ncbi:MAG: glycosyltransferase family 2 protein, partial [Streptococcus salivarius]
IRTQSDHANTELIQELTENTVTGGVAMINHALADLWTGQEKHALLMHDWYLALLATAFGKLIYIDQPTELYRQHSSNVLGARTLRKRVKNWVRPHILFAKYWNLIESSQEQAKNLLDLPVSSQTKEIIENFVTIMDVPLKERLRRIRQYGYRKNRAFHTFVFTSLILTKFAYRGKK